ncbi:MAG: DUF397 domain-containing protein [bacterium]|nr:DUF397 domain-containing protein [bacterium]
MKVSPRLFKEEEFKTPEMCTTGGVFDCVAVAINEHGVAVRSTADPERTTVTFSHEEWCNFISGVKIGAFNI